MICISPAMGSQPTTQDALDPIRTSFLSPLRALSLAALKKTTRLAHSLLAADVSKDPSIRGRLVSHLIVLGSSPRCFCIQPSANSSHRCQGNRNSHGLGSFARLQRDIKPLGAQPWQGRSRNRFDWRWSEKSVEAPQPSERVLYQLSKQPRSCRPQAESTEEKVEVEKSFSPATTGLAPISVVRAPAIDLTYVQLSEFVWELS